MELLTASRMSSLLACPRRHYWRYEVGLRRVESADALRFGSAWHRAMEALGQGLEIEQAYTAALGTAQEIDELAAATLWGLLAGYWQRYGLDRSVEVLHREVEFETAIDGSRTFRAAGKIDGLGRVSDGRLCLVEYKTTSASLEPDSDYWLRLRADTQILQYVSAARALGWDIATVVYDVTRKPTIRPRQIPRLDGDGLKIVLDNATGGRAMLANGKPRQAAGDGQTLQTDEESPREFGERLLADTVARPEFYFARREVPVLADDLEEFADLRVQVGRMILDRRAQQRKLDAWTPWRAWPRHVNGMQCPGCEYAGFCLQNATPDLAHPPAGYVVGEAHSELSNGGAA